MQSKDLTNCADAPYMFKVHEHKRLRSTLLAKVYLPIPHRNVTATSAPVEASEFSCDQTVASFHTGVGSSE